MRSYMMKYIRNEDHSNLPVHCRSTSLLTPWCIPTSIYHVTRHPLSTGIQTKYRHFNIGILRNIESPPVRQHRIFFGCSR